MKDYGLDGIFLQRFLTDIPGKRANRDTVLRHVMRAAKAHGRGFAIEYDVTGVPGDQVLSRLQADWGYLVDTLGLIQQPGYFRLKESPVVAVWGFGFNDGNHTSTPVQTQNIIQWFRKNAPVSQRAAFIGGVASWWRTRTGDASADSTWNAVYDSMDIIQPWMVGRYQNALTADEWRDRNTIPDMQRTQSVGRGYMPVIFPGFSWHNLADGPLNQIPRVGGRFLWRQAVNAKKSGTTFLKIAMFDEVDEGTAMFKCAPRRRDAPDQGAWLTWDADGDTILPSDWYLRVANSITRMYKGEIPASDSLPIKPGERVSVQELKPKEWRRAGPLEESRWGRVRGGLVFKGMKPGEDLLIFDRFGRVLHTLKPQGGEWFWNGQLEGGKSLAAGIHFVWERQSDARRPRVLLIH